MKPPNPEVTAALEEERAHEQVKNKEYLSGTKLTYEAIKPKTTRLAGHRRFLVSDSAVKHHNRRAHLARYRSQLVGMGRHLGRWFQAWKEVM